MELDLQSLFGLRVHSCTDWLRPGNPPSPAFGLIYEGAIGQPRYLIDDISLIYQAKEMLDFIHLTIYLDSRGRYKIRPQLGQAKVNPCRFSGTVPEF
jgi:hypothetical protein